MKNYLIPLLLIFSINIYAAEKSGYYSIIEKTFKDKDYSDGIKSLEQAIKEYPDESNFYSNLIFMYCYDKRFSDAVKLGSSVINRFPDNKYIPDSYRWGLVGSGWEEYNTKDFAKSLKTFKTAYDRFSDDKEVLNGYGCALREMKKYDEAIVILEKGFSKFPNDQSLKENLSWSYYYLADVMIKKGEKGKGGSCLNKFFELGDKNNPDVWANYFYKCSDLKLYDKGLGLLKDARRLFSNHEEIFKAGYWLYWNRIDDRRKAMVYGEMISDLKEICRYSSLKDVMHESGITYHHMSVSLAHVNAYEMIVKVCPYWKKFSGDEKEKSYVLLEYFKTDLPDELKFIEHNITGMILYREDRVDKAYAELEKGYREALKLPFAKKFKYDEAVYLPVPVKGFLDVSNVESRKYITHMGLNRNCYDFYGADADGSQYKKGVDPYKSKVSDWFGFGTNVFSPIDGVISEAESTNIDDSPYPSVINKGNFIHIKAEDGSIYNFYHLKKGSLKVKKGDSVKKGDILAKLGNSASSSPHLHFGVYSADWIVSRPVYFINYTSIKDGKRVFIKSGKPGIDNENYELIEVK